MLRPLDLWIGLSCSASPGRYQAFLIVAFVFKRPWLTAAVTAVVAALTFHVIFPVVLEVQLPTGLFGF